MVSKASEDLPEPDRPVITIRRSRGRSRSMFLRLCVRAPRMRMVSMRAGIWGRPATIPTCRGQKLSARSDGLQRPPDGKRGGIRAAQRRAAVAQCRFHHPNEGVPMCKWSGLSLALLLATGAAMAATPKPPSEAQVRQLMDVFGVDRMLGQMNAQMATMMQQQLPCVPAGYWQGFID